MTNDGGPAFPLDVYSDEQRVGQLRGMTLRDYFAAAAMQGWLATFGESRHPADNNGAASTARASYALADAMLAERAK